MATRPIKSISDFKGQLVGGGARPNLFEVQLANIPGVTNWQGDTATAFTYLCKAAQLPASTIANVDVPFRGRIFKVAGDRTIENWSITVINDEDFKIRNAFEEWMQLIAKLDNNLGATNPSSYMVDAGNAAALHKYVNDVAVSPCQSVTPGIFASCTSNRLGLAPPPTRCPLKSEMDLIGLVAIF